MGTDTPVKKLTMVRYARGWNVPVDLAHATGQALGDLAVQASTAADGTFQAAGAPPAPVPPILYADANFVLKYSHPDFETGTDFVRRQVLADADAFLRERGGHTVYLCFDQASPPNKGATHSKRYARTTPMPTPPADVAAGLVTDEYIVPADTWPEFTANRYLAARLLHYVTHHILGDDLPEDVRYTPPLGKRLFIHGGRRLPPPYPQLDPSAEAGRPDHQDGRMSVRHVPRPEPELLYVHYMVSTLSRSQVDGLPRHYRQHLLEQQRTERRAGVDPAAAPAALLNLHEGEMAVVYYAAQQPDPAVDAAFLTVDGDLIFILLLMARDRIDPATGTFRNRHVLWLKIPAQGGVDTVDVNRLYEDISEDPALSAVHDPVLTWTALSCLIFNDFMLRSLTGVGVWKGDVRGQDPSGDMPWLFRAFLDAPAAWSRLVRVITADRGDPRRPVEVLVDEDDLASLLTYTYACKWWPSMAKLAEKIVGLARRKRAPLSGRQLAHRLKWDEVDHDEVEAPWPSWSPLAWAEDLQGLVAEVPPATTEREDAPPSPRRPATVATLGRLTRLYLQHQRAKQPDYQVPTADRMRVLARQLQWVLEYWHNGYRGSCAVESPLATFQDLPYYGWERDHRGWVVSAPRVSAPRRTAGGHPVTQVLRASADTVRPAPSSSSSPPATTSGPPRKIQRRPLSGLDPDGPSVWSEREKE